MLGEQSRRLIPLNGNVQQRFPRVNADPAGKRKETGPLKKVYEKWLDEG